MLAYKPVLYVKDQEIVLPTRWAICSECDGNGQHSRHIGAITQEDRLPGGAWEDPEEFADYMAGHYDIRCTTCGGSGKVREVDESRLSKAELRAWRKQCREEADYQAICEAERRMGA